MWWQWQAGDEAGRRLAAVQLAKAKVAPRTEIASAFATTTVTLWRWEQAHDERGVAGLVPAKPGPKGAWKVTDEVVGQIVALRRAGRTPQQIADEVGVSRFSVRRVLADEEPAQPTGGGPAG